MIFTLKFTYPPDNLSMRILQKDLDTALSIAVDSRLDEAQTRVVRLLFSRNFPSINCLTSGTLHTQHLARFYVLASFGNDDQAKEALLMAHNSAVRSSSAAQANAAGSVVSDVSLSGTESAADPSTSHKMAAGQKFSSWATISLLCESLEGCSLCRVCNRTS
jgi:hypothetical protein